MAGMLRRKRRGDRQSSQRVKGSAARPVNGARTDVTAVAMVRMGERGETPRASEGLSRPIARENSPICGIVIPTRFASRGLCPARIEPTVFAAIFPTMNTPTTTSPGMT